MKRGAFLVGAVSVVFGATAGVTQAAPPAMAVIEFKNNTSAGWWYSGVGNDLADMLANELAGMNKFKMIERKQLGAVLGEQDLAADGRVKKESAAKMGKLSGAGYLVSGTVTAYEENVSGKGGAVAVHGIGVGGKKNEAYIAIDIRVINTTTGDITASRTVEAKSSSTSIGVGVNKGGVAAGFGKMEKTPAGQAIRACVIETAEYLACAMVDKGPCIDAYAKKDADRRAKTKGKVKIQ